MIGEDTDRVEVAVNQREKDRIKAESRTGVAGAGLRRESTTLLSNH